MIELQDIVVCYGERLVLSHLNWTILEGERVALLGPSGRGKTTLLRLLAGLLYPTSGRMTGLPPEGVSMVFQEDRLLPQLTVLENLSLVARNSTKEELLTLLEELGLAGEENRFPAELSGGMARRVAIGRAIASKRPLLLLDEPFKGLDAATHQQVLDTLDRRTKGCTMVLVTHSPQEAERLGCRCVKLEDLQLPSCR